MNIQGYGSITVDLSEKYENDDDLIDVIAKVVADVMQLVDPQNQKKRFHPVLGVGGYETINSRRTT